MDANQRKLKEYVIFLFFFLCMRQEVWRQMAQSRYCDSVTTGGQVLPVFLLGRPHHVDFDLTLAASWSQDDDSTSAPHLGKGIPQQAVPFYSAFLELLFSSFHFDLIGQNKLMCQGGENIFFFFK